MFLSNAYRPDPRVRNEALELVQAGYRVTVVCWDREASLPKQEDDQGVSIIRVHDVVSTYGVGSKQILLLPQFWRKALTIALSLKPDAVHCHDLDTLWIGWRMKKKTRCALIYDAHECYPAQMSLYLPRAATFALSVFEKFLHRGVDHTFTASSVLAREFAKKGVNHVTTLENCPNYDDYAYVSSEEVTSMKKKLNIKDSVLTIAYIGGFTLNREIIPFLQTAPLLPDVRFLVWGDGFQRERVASEASKHDNTDYLGWCAPADLPVCFRIPDIIFYGLKLNYPGAIYNAPNTISQAMAAGRPIIASNIGDAKRVISEADCGLLLDSITPLRIADAVNALKSPEKRQRLGENGRKTAESTYNRSQIAKKMLHVYANLV